VHLPVVAPVVNKVIPRQISFVCLHDVHL
jgi:hypothetical protein